jgi:F0F1-type ATP synthase membrane subunit c/vacuolar-type H+-ATPase subunit K
MAEIMGLDSYPQETRSEAVVNYAAAAFLVGLAVLAIGSGVGILVGKFKTPKTEPNAS